MAPPSLSQTRVIDPVLTNVARGYRNAMHVWRYLFPEVPVPARAGHIVEFGQEEFAELALERAPGENRKRLNFGHQGNPYLLGQRALDGQVTREQMEEAAAVPGIRYGMIAVRKTMSVVSLQIELAAAKLATTAGNYPNTNQEAIAAGSRWDKADVSPAKQVEAKKEEIAEGIGMEPNVLVVGTPVHRAVINNSDVIDRLKHTQGLTGDKMPNVDEQQLAQYFGVETYKVGRARTGTKGNFKPVWGKNAVLAFSEVADLADMGSPSYGYCYQLEGYPITEPGWYDKTCDSWLYPVTTEASPVIAGAAGGYLFRTVVD